jgi:Zn-dependent peptidase ImmA (M78 family)
MRPFVRFVMAREIFKHLVASNHQIGAPFVGAPSDVLDIEANLFAGVLLVPGSLLRKEVDHIDSSIDIIKQLAETFWVSKALMNQRLRDYMEHLN